MIGCLFRSETDEFTDSTAATRDSRRSPTDQTNPCSAHLELSNATHTHTYIVISDSWITAWIFNSRGHKQLSAIWPMLWSPSCFWILTGRVMHCSKWFMLMIWIIPFTGVHIRFSLMISRMLWAGYGKYNNSVWSRLHKQPLGLITLIMFNSDTACFCHVSWSTALVCVCNLTAFVYHRDCQQH